MARRHIKTIFAGLAVAFFATPLALLAVGVRAHEFENRRLERAPRVSDGWDAFQRAARYFTDHMPLREEAVRANTWISLHIFDTTPKYGPGGNPERRGTAGVQGGTPAPAPQPAVAPGAPADTAGQVLRGTDGWLYLQGEIDRACQPFLSFSDALSRWQQLVKLVRDSGRRAVAIVAPDKAVIYPEHLPADLPGRSCFDAATADLWGRLDPNPAGVVGLRKPVAAVKARSHDLVYKRIDSHWNELAALTLVRAALDAVGRGVRVQESEIRDPGPAEYAGDLAALLGSGDTDTSARRTIERAAGAPTVPGNTLIVDDSYADAVLPMLAPYFAKLETVHWDGSEPEQLAQAIARADTVIFETVQREFTFRASDQGYVTPGFLELLAQRLGR